MLGTVNSYIIPTSLIITGLMVWQFIFQKQGHNAKPYEGNKYEMIQIELLNDGESYDRVTEMINSFLNKNSLTQAAVARH